MQTKTLIGLALGSILSLAASAQTTNQNVRSLSLKECVDLALAHNLDVQIDRYSPQISRYLLRASYGAYDPTLNLTAQKAFDDEPAQFNPKKYAPPSAAVGNGLSAVRANSEYELTVDSVGPALGGLLPSGLAYNFFARSDHLDARTFATSFDQAQLMTNGLGSPPSLTNNYYATMGVTLRQPLLKDFWIDQPRRNIQLNKKNLKISELALRGDIMVIVTKVATAYYNLIFAREEVNVQRTALELANRLLEDTHKKVQAGTLTALDEAQAESDVETVRTALFAAEQNYSQHENTLKNLLTDNYQQWMDSSIVPSENLVVADLPGNLAASWVNALSRRPDLLQMRLTLEKQDINLRFNYNQRFPTLDVYGSYGWQAVQRTFSDSLNGIGQGSNPFYTVGVVLSFPLGNITARNNYKASQLAKQAAVVQFQKLQGDIISEVDTAVKLAATTFKQTASTAKARKYSADALEAVQKEYDAGVKTSFFVVEARRNLTRAQSAEVRALADYNIALVQLSLSEGTTLEKNHIDLKVK